ncbi:hypothetical protein EWG10_06115 [Salmonella enterica subsp. enterica serovar Napoli]|uniref:Uncharacterized protein n=1 Tax=Salmonella enterica subsp. enterica serovar Napoli TaxID=1151001 RepID=A0A5H8JK92_SALET|nr:hypothetical protein [Salmonella enterica subsp. enterica serovar Napoli]EAC0522524.1 hypothetical protein [Salmonella enterica subsp. enterica serovar Zaiman]EAU6665134.1 hypothetical protein [Salmonella enterica]ECF7024542.1 hypothetical protein [Salmonella enterica subsp. enterica]ECY8075377.1 hypothetical protein [Salmonella enterica subsp. enterica serovar Vitkin]EDW4661852.1 hypothetical protein [Salmonella enterica subsp. enterica serovar Bonn]EEN5245766.1 hypothetical protein [Salm
MKIEYQDYGAVANIIITSTVFEFRKHNRVVDAALLCTPSITKSRSGFFLVKSVLSGRAKEMLRAYKTVLREANR